MLNRKKRLIAIGALLLAVLVLNWRAGPISQAARLLVPANDNFANAQDVTAGPFPMTLNNVDLPTSSTTLEGGEVRCTNFSGLGAVDDASVWYKITPTTNGQLTATVTPQGNDDVTIGLFTAIGTKVICADAGASGGETETFPNQALTANTTYYIRVAADPNFNNPVDQANVSITFTATAAPEIQVLDGATDIPDNTGSVNFGTTPVNTPVTKVFTVKNTGTAALNLSGLTAPTGYSIAANFASTTVAANAQTTFSIKLDATAAGTPNGTVTFVTNDANENPFNFTVNGTVTSGSKIFLPFINKPLTGWKAETSGVTTKLNGVDCPSTTFCVAVGDGGQVLTTADGGTTWSSKTSGVTTNLHEVSCVSATTCSAVGDGGQIIRTSNSGTTWATVSSGTSQVLRGVGCGTSTCFAAGGTATSTGVFSFNGGTSWTPSPVSLGNTNLFGADCPNDGTCILVGDGGRMLAFAGAGIKKLINSLTVNRFEDVSCATDQNCVIAGHKGTIFTSSDGGSNWTPRTSGLTTNLEGVSCNGQTCYASGDGGKVITSANNGTTWSAETTGTTANLNAISCASTTACVAVGDGGAILRRR